MVIGACAILIYNSCNWDVPHDNPVDPLHYRYQPTGSLQLSIIDSATAMPLFQAEVRIPELGRFSLTNANGIVLLENIPTGTYAIYAERRGVESVDYKRITLDFTINANTTQYDTLKLAPLPPVPGSLTLRVLTLHQKAIPNATVQINSLGLFRVTDNNGNANFPEIPAGNWFVSAKRERGDGAVYVEDSISVTITPGIQSSTRILLDALPYFMDVSVNSVNIERGIETYIRRLRLTATVDDPDGAWDLTSVIWFINETMTGRLNYNPDSIKWIIEIPSDSLTDQNVDALINIPIKFSAIDAMGNSADTSKALARVIHRSPDLRPQEVSWIKNPTFSWHYYQRDEFSDISQFNYLVQIIREDPFIETVHSAIVQPIQNNTRDYTMQDSLSPGNYAWYVYVVDLHGNYSRSQRGRIVNVP